MPGILAVYNDVEPALEDQFNQWYNRQHLAERVAVAGFQSGRRYRAIDASHRYFAWYQTDNSEVMRSSQYLQRLEDPTRWTRHIMPNFRNMVRTVMTQSCKVGEGYTAFVGTLSLEPASRANGDATREWLVLDGLSDAVDGIEIVAAEYWLRDPLHTNPQTTESKLRDKPDAVLSANVVLHASTAEALLGVFDRLRDGLIATGAVVHGCMNRYAMIFSSD